MDAVARGAAAHHRLRPAPAVEGAGGVCAPRGRNAAAPGGEPAVGDGGAAAGGAGADPAVSASQHLLRLTLREKCAQMVHVAGVFPDEDPERTSQLVRRDGVGGMILSGGSVFDVPSFVNWAQKVAKFPLLVSADFELAGRVSGLPAFPPAAAIAATKSADFAQTKARHLGAEARALGIRMLLGPSAEDPLAAAAIDGYHYSKVAVCVKRFPDPGVGPLCGRAEALLIGHEVVPESDEEQIASLSRTEIQGVLRRERRIVGIAVTDERSRLW